MKSAPLIFHVSLLAAGALLCEAVAAPMPEKLQEAVSKLIQKRDFDRAVALCQPYASAGDKDAEFGVAILFALKAYVLRSERPASKEIAEAETQAITWLKRAKDHGNAEAADLYKQVQKRGPEGLYFISIEHLLQSEDAARSSRLQRRSRSDGRHEQ